MPNEKKTSPWVYVGAGCGVALVLLVMVALGLGYVGYRFAQQVTDDMKDPAAREAKVKAVMGADSFPPGYHPQLGLSIPLFMDIAIISDREEVESGGRPFDRRGFIYVNMRGSDERHRELRDFFEGRTTDAGILRQQSIRVRSGDLIRRGDIQSGERRILYVAQRGGVEMRNAEAEGVAVLLMPECPGDTRARLGIWFGPDPDPSAPIRTADFTGSPADENEMRAFVGHFDFCRAR